MLQAALLPAVRPCGTRRSGGVRMAPVCALSLRQRAGAALSAAALAATLASAPAAFAKAADFGVYWLSPADNDTVTSPVAVKFAVKGLEVKPAAEGLMEGTGHHHVIVDGPAFLKAGEEIPFDETHLHYGKGQTEAAITLTPGKHKLTLQFANALHKSYGKGYSKQISITVK